MQTNIDLRELAVRREGTATREPGPKRQLLSRYGIPAALLLGFLALTAWAARDVYWPRRSVTVIPVLATTAQVQKTGTPLFKAAGWVEPRPTATRVATLTAGVVKKLLVVEDQELQAGAEVAHLVDEDARLALKAAHAKHKLAKADVQLASAELEAAQTNFKYPVQLEATAAEARAELAKLETMLARLPFELKQMQAQLLLAKQELQSKKLSGYAVASIELNRAESKLVETQALVDDLQKRQESLGNERKALAARSNALAKKLELKTDEIKALHEAEAKADAAAAKLEEIAVGLAEAELRLQRMVIKAPIAGRVYQLVAVPGSFVAAGMGLGAEGQAATVVTMYQPDKLQLRVDVRFEDLPQVRPGQPVKIDSPALSTPLSGKVLFLSSLANIQKNTLQVKVAFDQPHPLLKPEMLVDCTFLAPEQPKSDAGSEQLRLLVPKQLVQNGDKGSFVWLADGFAGVATKQPVELGPAVAGGMVEVTRGLTISSKLIVGGLENLHDGSRIQITGADATPGTNGS